LRPRTENTVTARTATPAAITRNRLLSRSRNGFGLLLRGTDQALFIAFWMADPSPSDP
jgi:hypothetical protein